MTAEKNLTNKELNNKKYHNKNLRFLFTVIILIAFGLIFWRIFSYKTVDERLAAIEAARTIPDSENAAVIYNELLDDPNASSILSPLPESVSQAIYEKILNEPWHSSDYPQVSNYIEENQYVIDKLIKAGSYEKCRFPIIIDMEQSGSRTNRLVPIGQWAYHLCLAANNDLAENRIEAAISKWQTILRMSDHISQQPTIIEHITSYAIGFRALKHIARFVIDENTTEADLKNIEDLPIPVEYNWNKHLKQINKIESLSQEKLTENISLIDRLKFYISMRRMNKIIGIEEPDISNSYKRFITSARGIRILIGLRRYKDKHGHWPESLEAIESIVPDEALLDPSGGKFEYKKQGENFSLSGKLQNIWPQ